MLWLLSGPTGVPLVKSLIETYGGSGQNDILETKLFCELEKGLLQVGYVSYSG